MATSTRSQRRQTRENREGWRASGFSPAVYARIETALWIYDFDACRIVWANRSALALWDAETAEALAERDMAAEMSVSVRKRLEQHRDDFDQDLQREIREFWTLYPQGAPFRVRATLRRWDFEDRRLGMLVEARAEDQTEPTTIRSADALLHTRVMTALFDRNRGELYANPAFRAAFGPGRRSFGADFVHQADLMPFQSAMIGTGEHRETVRVRTVEGERWHDIYAVRCRDAVTGDGAFLISAFDVTDAREQQRQLADALDAAKAAARAKSRFLATMSHEMRTPLNGVLGMASILDHGGLSERQQRCVEVIRTSGSNMLAMVEGMLDIVALDAGTMTITHDDFDPALVVETAVESVRADAERKSLRLVADLSRMRRVRYRHDATRIRQVLGQLLSNAIKFTERGEIIVRVFTTGSRERPRGLRFEVSDTGPGVPVAARDRIFERFYQGDGSITRSHGGTGLGLAICKELVTLWGGEIGLTCGRAGGSTFWFDAPDCVDL